MFNIAIDLTGVRVALDRLGAVHDAIQAEIPNQLVYLQTLWAEAVSGRVLSGMHKAVRSEEYLASITDARSLSDPFNGDPFWGVVLSTEPVLALRVEEGYPAFDMKPGLLGGKAAKTSKDGGRYVTIPFRHGTPGTTGQHVGAAMPPAIYAMARTLGRGQSLTGVAGVGRRTQPAMPPARQTSYTWKTGPYEGMQKRGAPGHSQYMTWRRVSDKSDPSAWVHPGQDPNPVMRAVVDTAQPIIQQNLETLVRRLAEGG